MSSDPPTRVDRPAAREAPEPVADWVRLDEVGSIDELGELGFAERYERVRALGRGGMGEVLLAQDHRIGRAVAIKIGHARDHSGDSLRRFVREARIQGQLDHPAMVPVYDLGARPDGDVFFTMKRVRGVTLDAALVGLRRGDADAAHRYGRRRLLTAYIVVCQAIELAHARGVVHRDLKPANIMLGDYGEVYVLDWGVAKLATDPDPHSSVIRPSADDADTDLTLTGTFLGTPGYMPPEQAGGHPVDHRADIYALGALLFEILTLQPLHPRDSMDAVIASTMAGADARASRRYPDRAVPPELEATCIAATAARVEDRTPSVAEMRAAVESFMDGDRDLERRSRLAQQLASAADAALPAALAGDHAARTEAMQLASRALALAPDLALAQQAIVRLTLTPPRQPPPEVIARVEANVRETFRLVARVSAFLYLTWLPLGAIVLWMGLRDIPTFAVWMSLILATAGANYYGSRRDRYDAQTYFVGLLISSVALATTGRLFGPYVLAPTLLTVNTIGFLLHSRPSWRPATVVVAVASLLAPIALELAGVLAVTTTFEADRIVIHATAASFGQPATSVALIGLMVSYAVVIGLAAGRLRDRRVSDELRVQMGAWQLAQLVPQSEHSGVSRTPVQPPYSPAPAPAESQSRGPY